VYIKCVTMYLCTVCVHTTSQHTRCTSSVSPCTCVQRAYIPPHNTHSVHQVCHHVPVYSVRTYHLTTHSVHRVCHHVPVYSIHNLNSRSIQLEYCTIGICSYQLGDITVSIAKSATLRLSRHLEIIRYCAHVTCVLLARHKTNSQQHLHDRA